MLVLCAESNDSSIIIEPGESDKRTHILFYLLVTIGVVTVCSFVAIMPVYVYKKCSDLVLIV